jgi:hypothetical protein
LFLILLYKRRSKNPLAFFDFRRTYKGIGIVPRGSTRAGTGLECFIGTYFHMTTFDFITTTNKKCEA